MEIKIEKLAQGKPERVEKIDMIFLIQKKGYQKVPAKMSHMDKLFSTIKKTRQNETGQDSLWEGLE